MQFRGHSVPGFGIGDDISRTSDWTDEDLAAYLAFADRLGIADVSVPLRVWASESNNRPHARGPAYASGILSLTPLAAQAIGYDVASDPTLERFRALPVRDQLPWAERYYATRTGPIDTVARFYVQNYLPGLLKYADNPSFVLARAGSGAYDGNWTTFDAKRDSAGRPIPSATGAPQPDKGWIQVSDLVDAANRATGPRTNELIARALAMQGRV